MPGNFTTGDKVALSATFLRSICASAAMGKPTRYDMGKGFVIETIPCGDIQLVDVWFPDHQCLRRINSFNLIHARDIYRDAMSAEHEKNPNFRNERY